MSLSRPGASDYERNLVDVIGLKKYFPIRAGLIKKQVGAVRAVDDVTFFIKKGETLGLVGESGCGKTTVGRTVLRLLDPVTGGTAHFQGTDLFGIHGAELRATRRRMQPGGVDRDWDPADKGGTGGQHWDDPQPSG